MPNETPPKPPKDIAACIGFVKALAGDNPDLEARLLNAHTRWLWGEKVKPLELADVAPSILHSPLSPEAAFHVARVGNLLLHGSAQHREWLSNAIIEYLRTATITLDPNLTDWIPIDQYPKSNPIVLLYSTNMDDLGLGDTTGGVTIGYGHKKSWFQVADYDPKAKRFYHLEAGNFTRGYSPVAFQPLPPMPSFTELMELRDMTKTDWARQAINQRLVKM